MSFVGDFVQRRIEIPFFRGQADSGTVCCLPRVKTQDVTLRLDRLLKLVDKDPLAIVYISPNATVLWNLLQIIEDFRELRTELKKENVQVIFCLPSPKDMEDLQEVKRF